MGDQRDDNWCYRQWRCLGHLPFCDVLRLLSACPLKPGWEGCSPQREVADDLEWSFTQGKGIDPVCVKLQLRKCSTRGRRSCFSSEALCSARTRGALPGIAIQQCI